MKIAMDKLCRVFSHALDIIEAEQNGVSEYHGARVAVLCAAAGRRLGYNDDAISALAICALFHDNALTEFNVSEKDPVIKGKNVVQHCEKGQSSVAWLPFEKNIDGYILYHHERADGKGPFGMKEGEYPFEAALIAAANSIDVMHHLESVAPGELSALRDKIQAHADRYSTRSAISSLLDIFDGEMLESLHDENIHRTLSLALPQWNVDVTEDSVTAVAGFFAHIIDYKSKFTRKHTSQIANRAWLMAEHYGFNDEEKAALYLAASLHDLGKIATPTEVLEKPGKLDPDEFDIIKKHVWHTHEWLKDMPDFDLIRNWAADHHEKLDGTGYSFGKKAQELDIKSRLLACIDIYQAVCEERPYHAARTHGETMPILYGMAEKGFIDAQIVKDMDEVMAKYSMQDIPPPRRMQRT